MNNWYQDSSQPLVMDYGPYKSMVQGKKQCFPINQSPPIGACVWLLIFWSKCMHSLSIMVGGILSLCYRNTMNLQPLIPDIFGEGMCQDKGNPMYLKWFEMFLFFQWKDLQQQTLTLLSKEKILKLSYPYLLFISAYNLQSHITILVYSSVISDAGKSQQGKFSYILHISIEDIMEIQNQYLSRLITSSHVHICQAKMLLWCRQRTRDPSPDILMPLYLDISSV